MKPRQQLLAASFAAALAELLALAGDVGDHQAAAVQHADELLQLFDRDLLRRKRPLELDLDLVQARLAVEHLQDGVLFFLKAEVVQPDRLLDHPVDLAQIALLLRRQVGPHRASAAPGRSWRPGYRLR